MFNNNDKESHNNHDKNLEKEYINTEFHNEAEFGEIEDDISKIQNQFDYSDMKAMSEYTYNSLASTIITNSISELNNSATSKRNYKLYTAIVFTIMLAAFLFLMFFLILNEKQYNYRILIVYLSSLMVEIIFTVQLFIKLIFDNSYQTSIIKILHKFLENFQKIE